jgi:sodium-dependent dicarboxylate transporter 2/3/5
MLPIATPPNAIVFASGHIAMQEMRKSGFWLNLLCLLVITALAYTFSTYMINLLQS